MSLKAVLERFPASQFFRVHLKLHSAPKAREGDGACRRQVMAVSFHKPAIPFVPVSRRLVSSFTILTTAAKHERVPVILHPEECGRLLDWSLTDPTGLSGLFLPYPAELLEMWPVSPLVNTPKHDGCELIAPPKTRGNFVCTMQKSE